MNFGLATFRELIEDFLSSSGGRRGRQREERRQSNDGFAGESGGGSAADPDSGADSTESDDGDDESDGESDGGSAGGGLFGRGSSKGDEDDLDDLFYRIEELEEQLEDKENELGTVQDSQQQVAEQMEEMNERVRQLLGVYDRVTDDVNPFTGEGEAENGFGVFGEDEAGARETATDGFGLQAGGGAESTADDETVSFDDLKGVIEDAAAAQSSGGETITFDEDAADGTATDDEDDTRVEVQATSSVEGPDEASASADGAAAGRSDESTDDDSDDVTLATLADTYATDILVFEWLTQLVRTGGSAATLRAISYYAEIGWISKDVKHHLESVLSGPDLDIHVDPGSPPEELTAEDHADSYTYIMKLQEIHETKREVEPERSTPQRGP
ncbi:FlaD/FlaE family flagellar protein [Haloterrigena alkaliphila]|uniref:Flagella accessory C family protein n=1 Tax=Haloterrigena alkaliphila TaxID=2816475 RepID=A0A8A2VIR8_9EURY|nr:FlaD/FlaE family flagellar protein [Haloterrigena alkaliphila]QSX00285.1 flagella accessory C family protein [Haloterrigena alkaliphila]